MPRNPDQPAVPQPPKPPKPQQPQAPAQPAPPPVAQFPSASPAPAAPAAPTPQGPTANAPAAPAVTPDKPLELPPVRAPSMGAGGAKGAVLPEFARPTGPSTGPTDFVNFSTYAGLNGDQLKGIANQAMQDSAGKQKEAMKLLMQAEQEAGPDMPVEKTPSWQKYQDAMAAVNDNGNGLTVASNGTYDGNYMEGALRGVYAPAQDARLGSIWQGNMTVAQREAANRNQQIAEAVQARRNAAALAQQQATAASRPNHVAPLTGEERRQAQREAAADRPRRGN